MVLGFGVFVRDLTLSSLMVSFTQYVVDKILPGLLSNQGEKSINCYFIIVLLRKKY